MSGHEVYRLYGESGALLYVGVTRNRKQRMASHRRTKVWWSEVDEARTTWVAHATAADASAAELSAILTEAPRYNSAGATTAYLAPAAVGDESLAAYRALVKRIGPLDQDEVRRAAEAEGRRGRISRPAAVMLVARARGYVE